MSLRYGWVVAGLHEPAPADAGPRPRAEFEVFLERFGGQLLSRSSLAGSVPASVAMLKKIGWPRMALGRLVQSRASQVDAIIASGEDIGIPIALASLTGTARVPIHMMFHGHHLDSPKLLKLAPLLRRLSHVHFHCLSESLRGRTQAVLGIPPERCHASGYGIDTSYFAETETPATGPIASAGAANRDYATLASAVCELPVELRIAADSTWVPITTQQSVQWPTNVKVRSYGDYARLRELYSQAKFVVVPLHPASHACGYAVIAEAMAMGRAVIVTRTESPPDYLVPGQTGLFAQAHDVDGLRETIRHLLDHPAEATRLGRQARALMAESHSLERYCDRLERIVAASVRAS